MFRNYFTFALRNLRRSKVVSFINIAGLSLGLACCLLDPLYLKDDWSYDRFHHNRDEIYRITTQVLNEDTLHWWVFALAVLITLLIAWLTVGFRALKAAIANPVKNLRVE